MGTAASQGNAFVMAEKPLETVLEQLRQAVCAPAAEELADQQLLQRFTTQQEEAAFATLVRRHGPMVFGVCRRVLRDAHQAEDAFQATFLVLARKAGSIRKQESVASWLHGVAYRIAGKARASAYRRSALERRAMGMRQVFDDGPPERSELEEALDQELHKLPEKYRAPLVLCYLQGKSNEEAAEQLGWTTGTVRGRLFRGRDLLRGRLVRRGLGATSGVALTALMAEAAQAAVPPALLETTVRAGLLFAKGGATNAAISASAATMAEGAMRGLFWEQLKTPLAIAAATGLASLAVFVGYNTFAEHRPPDPLPTGTENSGQPAVQKLDQAVEIDVLRSMVVARPFLPGLLDALEKGAHGKLLAETVLTDELGGPAANQDVLFRWRTGEETLRTDAAGVVRFEIKRATMDGLKLLVPQGYAAKVRAVNEHGVQFDFGVIDESSTQGNFDLVRNSGIEVFYPRGRTATGQQALNDLLAMRIFCREHAGLDLVSPCRLVILAPGEAAPTQVDGLQLISPMADYEAALAKTASRPAEMAQWLALHRWAMVSLASNASSSPGPEAGFVRSALAEVLAYEFCVRTYPQVATLRLKAFEPQVTNLAKRGVKTLDLRSNLNEGGGSLAFLYWQQAATAKDGLSLKELTAQALDNPEALCANRSLGVEPEACVQQLRELLDACERAGKQ
jgi:RNA polymerase sigma factor (sigma-70 family)